VRHTPQNLPGPRIYRVIRLLYKLYSLLPAYKSTGMTAGDAVMLPDCFPCRFRRKHGFGRMPPLTEIAISRVIKSLFFMPKPTRPAVLDKHPT
jgi:hypothetical protein